MQERSTFFAGVIGWLDRWRSSQNSHIVDLVRGASIAGLLKAVSAVLAFGLSVVLGRVLGADAAGVYFLALTTAMIAATIGRVGLAALSYDLLPAMHQLTNGQTSAQCIVRRLQLA